MRTLVITGATGKIGKVLVKHFLLSGDSVVGIGRTCDSLVKLNESIGHLAKNLYSIPLDLTIPGASVDLMEQLGRMNLSPDCLINNARNASYLSVQANGYVSRDSFVQELTLDVVVPYELTSALASFRGTRLSAVVNIGSQYGLVAPNLSLYQDPERDAPLHYGVAKAALSHLTKELAVRLAKKNIRVNCVAFGGVEGRVDKSFQDRYSSLCPMSRMLKESELAQPVDMLLSESASAITGTTLVVDCGWSLW
jgi:NAD(P)-dependent dehydrogenase (short-subunit alcohol dehydrogenase family)